MGKGLSTIVTLKKKRESGKGGFFLGVGCEAPATPKSFYAQGLWLRGLVLICFLVVLIQS
jgi:hypothetical protein